LNLVFFTLRHWSVNCGFEAWVFSLIIGYCSYVSGEVTCECVRVTSRGRHSVW